MDGVGWTRVDIVAPASVPLLLFPCGRFRLGVEFRNGRASRDDGSGAALGAGPRHSLDHHAELSGSAGDRS